MNTQETPLNEHRRQNFAVEVTPARNPLGPGELSMSISHNGYQWTNICLLPDEAKKVAETLLSALANDQFGEPTKKLTPTSDPAKNGDA